MLSQALETEEFEGLADPRLEKNYNDREMFLMIEVAAACVRHSAVKRPRMGQVASLDSKFDGTFPSLCLDLGCSIQEFVKGKKGRQFVKLFFLLFSLCFSFASTNPSPN